LRLRTLEICCVLSTLGACSVYESGLVASSERTETSAGASGKTSGAAGDDASMSKGGTAGGNASGSAAGNAGVATMSGGNAGAAAGATAGSSGSATLPEAGASGAGGVPPQELVLEPLDDMEDGNAFVLAADERNGHWDVSNDGTMGATQTPPAAGFVMAEIAESARPDSHFAAYTQGGGFKGWGAILTVSMITWPDYAQTPTYDASAYGGISFYAKAGADSDSALRVRFVGAQTDDRGGQCTPGGDITTACFDHFFADVKLSQEWQRFDLGFADFRQAGVGKKFASIDLDTMYALEFFFAGRSSASGNAFELWVDDLAFVLK
jgi:hypothetical protein